MRDTSLGEILWNFRWKSSISFCSFAAQNVKVARFLFHFFSCFLLFTLQFMSWDSIGFNSNEKMLLLAFIRFDKIYIFEWNILLHESATLKGNICLLCNFDLIFDIIKCTQILIQWNLQFTFRARLPAVLFLLFWVLIYPLSHSKSYLGRKYRQIYIR